MEQRGNSKIAPVALLKEGVILTVAIAIISAAVYFS